MSKSQDSQISTNIERYCQSKSRLESLLASGADRSGDFSAVKDAEVKLEEAFSMLLQTSPENVADALAKCDVFISEILSDVELTRYQAKALKCMIDDLEALSRT